MRLEPDIITILDSATVTGNQLKTTAQLDRPTYMRVNKALECLGGKWNRSAKAHVFESDPREIIRAACDDGKVTDAKKEFQFFPTPAPLARKMVQLADLQPNDLILEPSAGHGAIVDAIIESETTYGRSRAHVLARVRMCELMPQNQAVLKRKGYSNIIADDFLTLNPDDCLFDKIIANPPFNKNQDIEHVRHMFEVLKPGGRIVTLTSPGWTFNDRKTQSDFRRWVNEEGFYIEEIPSGTFKDTEIRTMLLVITKPGTVLSAPRRQKPTVAAVCDRRQPPAKPQLITVQPSLF